jgi:uncharacterized protein YbjT (DUF2867 family)
VGASLVRDLLAAGVSVRAASFEAPGVAHSSSLSTVRLDLDDPDTWPPALARIRRVFLDLSGPAIPDGSAGLAGFLAHVASAGVDNVVLLSSAAMHGAVPHQEAERHVDAAGLPRTFLRPAMLHQRLADEYGDDIAEHDRLRMPIGDGRVTPVDARDVARAAAVTLTSRSPSPRATYDLTGPEALTGRQIAALMSRVLGRDITFEPTAPEPPPVPDAADHALHRLLGRLPTSLADYVHEHRARWAASVV